jgi:hypothetical protein
MKLLIIMFLLVSITGCAGTVKQSYQLNAKGEPIFSKYLGRPLMKRERTSKTTDLGGSLASSVESMAKQNIEQIKLDIAREKNRRGIDASQCNTATPEQIAAMPSATGAAYYANYGLCLISAQSSQMVSLMASALENALKGDSDLQTVAKVYGSAINTVETEDTRQISAVANPLQKVGLGIELRKGVQSGNEAVRDTGIAGINGAGDTTVGNISLGGGLSNGAQANVGEGEGGGSGQGTSTNTSNGGTTIVNIGDENNTAISNDSGRSFAGTTATQQIDSDGTGLLIQDGTVDQFNAIDENNAEISNQPQKRGDSLLDL